MPNSPDLTAHAEPLAVISSSHLDPQTLLDFGYLETGSAMYHGHVIYPNDYGAFLQTEVCSGGTKGVDEEAHMPQSLRLVLDWALAHRFKWIKFDSSGPEIQGMATYDHS